MIGATHGAEAYIAWGRSLLEVADDLVMRADDDVVAIRSDALLVHYINTGTERVGGGAFERHLLGIWIFGTDGLVARLEQFDLEAEEAALARFDELADGASPPASAPSVPRRVRANAATANAARLGAAVVTRDVDALSALWADELEVVDHTTGIVYGRQGESSSFLALLRAQDPTFGYEPLATLGDSLALCRMWHWASALADGELDVGAFEREVICPVEVDAQGRQRWGEIFAADRLGDAVVRLYERYADLLPDGPERARAAATARSVAVLLGPPDLDPWATAFAPSIEWADPRTVGCASAGISGSDLCNLLKVDHSPLKSRRKRGLSGRFQCRN